MRMCIGCVHFIDIFEQKYSCTTHIPTYLAIEISFSTFRLSAIYHLKKERKKNLPIIIYVRNVFFFMYLPNEFLSLFAVLCCSFVPSIVDFFPLLYMTRRKQIKLYLKCDKNIFVCVCVCVLLRIRT